MVLTDSGRQEHILCLNWNTMLLQSYGFVELMKSLGLDDGDICRLDQTNLIHFLLQYPYRNLSYAFDKDMVEKQYYDFVKLKYKEISEISPMTGISSVLSILLFQKFVSTVHIASCKPMTLPEPFEKAIRPTFDIFDIEQIENYIIENSITAVFVHDIRIVRDLILRFRIEPSGMIFIVSKIGYNFEQVQDITIPLCTDVIDLKESLNFNIGFIDVMQLTEDMEVITPLDKPEDYL